MANRAHIDAQGRTGNAFFNEWRNETVEHEAMIQVRPEICGRIASTPLIGVRQRISPSNSEPRHDTPVSRSPGFIRPRASIKAIRADIAVPVGERSILPGRIATAERLRNQPFILVTG